jgi:exodeoxyribonuclease V alpha subunit
MQDMKSSIDRLFPRNGASLQPDWQKAAAITALLGGLTVITGGPGTGKTTTVARILALMLEQDSRMKIAVAAPTGKAAGRIKESIKREKESLNVSEEVREKIPLSTSTIHRLLGPSVNSPNFRHNREYPLAADLVVVDEASMVDLPLMAKLLDAMKRDARLILLGDRNQLASVETGSVFGDICTPRNVDSFSSGFASRLSSLSGETFPAQVKQGGWLTDSVIELKNYRFGEDTSIGRLSREIVRGCGDGVMELLRDCRNSTGGQVTWRELPGRQDFPNALKKRVGGYFSEYAGTRDVSEAFQKLAAFRLLSPLRSGWWGIEQINMIIEKLILAEYREPSFPRTYPRKPLLVTANDYNLMLFNGDLGIVFADGSGPLRVFFESDRDEGDRFRSFSPGRLPPYEPAYAMTVHKSQGSEFDELLLVLPPEDSPILTLEILYTAVTRARKRVEIWGSEEVIRKCVGRRIERISGIGTNT